MFKLLVADDERLEREAIKFIISTNIESIIDIQEATNGREAITKAQCMKPDIIILDIHMPGINGIEAAWKIREKNTDVLIIFLTAFHEFDYAHEAIKIGVEDYIIKPSSDEKILKVINTAIYKLKNKRENQIEKENIGLKLDKATDYLCSEFTYNLATRSMSEEKFKNYLTLMDTEFYYGRGLIVKLDFDSYPIKIDSDYQRHILKKRSLRLIKNIFNQHGVICTTNSELNNLYIFVYTENKNIYMEESNQLDIIIKKIDDSIKEILNINIMLGYGSLIREASSCIHSFCEAKMFNKSKLSIDKNIPLDLEINLEQSIMSGDKAKTETLFKELEEWLLLSPELFKCKRRSIKDLSAVLRHSAATLFPECINNIDLDDINIAKNTEELISAVRGYFNYLLDVINNSYKKEHSPVIKNACNFIDQNFHNDITLEETATYCNLSPFYFSKIFKEDKKQNFINYLTEVRINKAKNLLKTTNLSIKEVTCAIGYNDPNYFTRVFKKETSFSPSEFRSNKMLS